MIKIYPLDSITKNSPIFERTKNFSLQENYKFLYYTINAKAAIQAICRKYCLKRTDEVAIFTTTDMPYVSTCVSATLFNYSKISRVLSSKTKLIYVIHEFGAVHESIDQLKKISVSRGIPLIEDCAHSPISNLAGRSVGFWGDYCIYSLSKHIPVKSAGVVCSKTELKFSNEELFDPFKIKDLKNLIELIPEISKRRSYVFENILKSFGDHIFLPYTSTGAVPYFAILKSKNADVCQHELTELGYELGRTYNKSWICIPTQPFASMEEWNVLFYHLRRLI